MRSFLIFVAIVACALSCGFSILAAHKDPAAANEPSDEPLATRSDSTDQNVPRQFVGFANVSEFRGVIDDPDGYVNLRKEKRADAPVVTKVKAGEVFEFRKKEGEDWCPVKLKSGVSGWMHYSRIKLYFTEDDLPGNSEEGDEIEEQARKQGVNYFEVTQAAARGDKEALKTFLSIGGDGAAAEEAEALKGVMIHLIGDDRLAELLREQPPRYQMELRDFLSGLGDATHPFEPVEYLHRHFPKTAKLFFRREIDFPSPDGRYAIHKVFANDGSEDDPNKVTRSELIEKATGKIIKDLTKDDQGTGRFPQGDIEWAPDSKGFLYFVFSQPDAVKAYRLLGKSFAKIELPDWHENTPPRERDPSLGDAVFHSVSYALPGGIHWSNPNTLVAEKTYEYTKGTDESGVIQYLERKYEVTMTIAPDGKVASEEKQVPTAKQ
jgi:Bacterial SH3 domain